MTEVCRFSIEYSRYLDPDGRPRKDLPDFAEVPENLTPLYRAMVLTRVFDAKAVALQRTGRLGTYASSLGQEAVSVGLAAAMQADDILLPSFREQGAQLLRGVTMTKLLQYWGGDERGSDFETPREDFPICVPVGTHAPHAAGVALAIQLRGERRAAVCVLGDGATSKGDVYEAMNLAGVWKLPVVFLINNNAWAISVPRERQSAAQTLAQKAIAAGIEGLQVDGNDVIAVRQAVTQALGKARSGGGATVIEALTFRLSDHTTADDAGRYRDDAEVSRRWKEEPVARLRRFLTDAGTWTKEDEESLLTDCAEKVEAAVERYLETAPQSPVSMFDFLYERRVGELDAQCQDMMSATDDTEGAPHG